jgi:Sprouty protein (Spry)
VPLPVAIPSSARRCKVCRTPSPLFSKSECPRHERFRYSAEKCIDYASCLCCVKALFYLCDVLPDENGGTWSNQPCSCDPEHERLARLSSVAAISLVLPCLVCYWPLKGALKVVEKCNQRCTRHGCRCDHLPSSHDQYTVGPSFKHATVSQPLPSKQLFDTDFIFDPYITNVNFQQRGAKET